MFENPASEQPQASGSNSREDVFRKPSQKYEGNNAEDDFTSMSISPLAVNTLFPSTVQQQLQRIPSTRPSRESVLQRLSEALLRRSLTKV